MPLISAEKPVNVYFFKSNGCPHCAKEKSFLDNLKADPSFSNIVVNEYEVGSNLKNAQLFSKVGKLLNANVAGVPFTVIGSTQIVGYSNDSSTGELIKSAIKRVQNGDERDILAEFISGNSVSSTTPVSIPEKLTFLGKSLNIKSLSLPGLTMVLALLDGFNPCAMWVLFFLISMILGLESRKKMWLIGSTFIAASGLVYFLILSAWLNVFLLIGYVKWVQLGLGFFALTGGVYTLYKTVKDSKGGCEVTSSQDRKNIFEKIKNIIREEMNKVGGIEILMSSFQPKENWEKTGRWKGMNDLYKVSDSSGREIALGPTHEEIVVPILKNYVSSYKDLPVAIYQIQNFFFL